MNGALPPSGRSLYIQHAAPGSIWTRSFGLTKWRSVPITTASSISGSAAGGCCCCCSASALLQDDAVVDRSLRAQMRLHMICAYAVCLLTCCMRWQGADGHIAMHRLRLHECSGTHRSIFITIYCMQWWHATGIGACMCAQHATSTNMALPGLCSDQLISLDACMPQQCTPPAVWQLPSSTHDASLTDLRSY